MSEEPEIEVEEEEPSHQHNVDTELVPFLTDVPGYLSLLDESTRNEARTAWAIQQLVSSEGVLPTGWQEELKDMVKALRDGVEVLKHPKAKTTLGVVKGGAGADVS